MKYTIQNSTRQVRVERISRTGFKNVKVFMDCSRLQVNRILKPVRESEYAVERAERLEQLIALFTNQY